MSVKKTVGSILSGGELVDWTCRRPMATAASLRLMADLKAISQEPPDGCSASPASEENLFVWSATSRASFPTN